jgi:glutamine synthetase
LKTCEKLGEKVQEHIEVYGPNNEKRLTGFNETCSIKEFRYGIGDRTASVRIPSSIEDKETPGYFRR